ncbi:MULTISPECIES: hypothetical protein [unclassified Nonomuraea]|uniref:hypothetical protein n=1 Tax=unclassified Nonomuraea TaxID=2593643 RepID=UPI0034006916
MTEAPALAAAEPPAVLGVDPRAARAYAVGRHAARIGPARSGGTAGVGRVRRYGGLRASDDRLLDLDG